MNAEVFVDTNVLLCTIDEDPASASKRQQAQQLLLSERWGWSVQVAAEFFVNATLAKRPFRLAAADAAALVEACVREHDRPAAITAVEKTVRTGRIVEIASGFGFIGDVEYHHVYSQSGGAQYGIGPCADDDVLIVYADAFERDGDPDDFCLEALIAHECGHQRLHRDSTLQPVLANFPGDELEEVLASLIGSILLRDAETSQTLVWKAAAELTDLGMTPEQAKTFADRLEKLLRQLQ